MPRELTHRLEELKREIERQDEQWAEVESHMRALSQRGIAIARSVIDDIDEAFGASPHAAVLLHHTFC
jgi:hypothetical protein